MQVADVLATGCRGVPLMRTVSLTIALAIFWLALSGFFKPLLLTLGVASVILTILFAHRMGVVDGEGHPIGLLPAASTYWPWLIWEIMKSAWAVTKIILSPRIADAISPTMTRVVASQHTPTGVVTYANSITLTPGTITVGVRGNMLTVHALTRDGADDLEGGGMDDRVTRFEKGAL